MSGKQIFSILIAVVLSSVSYAQNRILLPELDSESGIIKTFQGRNSELLVLTSNSKTSQLTILDSASFGIKKTLELQGRFDAFLPSKDSIVLFGVRKNEADVPLGFFRFTVDLSLDNPKYTATSNPIDPENLLPILQIRETSNNNYAILVHPRGNRSSYVFITDTLFNTVDTLALWDSYRGSASDWDVENDLIFIDFAKFDNGCIVLDTQGNYHFEYVSTYNDLSENERAYQFREVTGGLFHNNKLYVFNNVRSDSMWFENGSPNFDIQYHIGITELDLEGNVIENKVLSPSSMGARFWSLLDMDLSNENGLVTLVGSTNNGDSRNPEHGNPFFFGTLDIVDKDWLMSPAVYGNSEWYCVPQVVSPVAINNQYYVTADEISAGDRVHVFFHFYDIALGIRQAQTNPLPFSVYPNPATDFIHLRLEGIVANELQYSVVSQEGRMVQQGALSKKASISVQDLSKGSYHLFIKDNQGRTGHQQIVVR